MDLTYPAIEFHRRNLLRNWSCDDIMQVMRLASRLRLLEV